MFLVVKLNPCSIQNWSGQILDGLVINTPLRSQSRQLPDVISIEISQPDLLSTEITFQIPNYFQITFKLISNYFQINLKLLG